MTNPPFNPSRLLSRALTLLQNPVTKTTCMNNLSNKTKKKNNRVPSLFGQPVPCFAFFDGADLIPFAKKKMPHVAETGSCQRLWTLASRPAAGVPGPNSAPKTLTSRWRAPHSRWNNKRKARAEEKACHSMLSINFAAFRQRFARSFCLWLFESRETGCYRSEPPPVTPDGPRGEEDVRCVNRGRWGRECSGGGVGVGLCGLSHSEDGPVRLVKR